MEEKNDTKANFLAFAGFVAVIMFIILFSRNDADQSEKYRKTFKGETIALATRIKHSGKTSSLRYYFYTNKKVLSEVSSRDYGLVNKFYKVKYDLDNPEKGNYIVLEEELEPDSISLVKAGFTKTKYYIYDAGVTCKYIEKSKWK
jgi:hypothetical protein